MLTFKPALKPLICCLSVCGCIILGILRSRSRRETVTLVGDRVKEQCQQLLPPLDTRNAMGTILEAEQAQVGVELGVQTGLFAATTLQHWTCNKKYYLVDIWAPLENYLDKANVGKWPVADGGNLTAIAYVNCVWRRS